MFFVWVVIIGLLQMTVLKGVNLLVALAVFAGLRKGMAKGLLVGGTIGAFMEFLSGSPFGLNIALYSMVGFLSGLARTHIYYKENIIMEFIFSFSGVCLFYFAYFILARAPQTSIFSTALLTAIISPAVFRIAGR